MAARCNVVRPPPDWRSSSSGSSRFLCSFQADSNSDASKYFGLTMGLSGTTSASTPELILSQDSPCPSVISRSGHGVVVGSGLTTTPDTRALGPVDNDLRLFESRSLSSASTHGAGPDLSLACEQRSATANLSLAQFSLRPSVSTQSTGSDLSSALGQRVERLATGRISSRDESVFLHRNAVSSITYYLRAQIRPRFLRTAIPHPRPSPACIRGPWWVFLVPPVPDPSPMMCAAIRLHYPFRKHALHSLATSTSLTSPVLDPFLARCATATAHPPRPI
ncbi:hypothetical protein B0H16DRAFT_1742967 [Mycena metata]|uniref:Uncharacterized protein n=1 Tax=Mycena metata TaxID=1033252 RepID=A0AAD7H6Y4_9AGAR|nr:hypothetical protein B0H16DRAFT_1742946 [Mycena metata]KAJ7713939.1 hypothetical protein B0H16DRAFT_1742967 [Mycena metata]